MKKFFVWMLTLSILFLLFDFSVAQAADTKSATVAVPITTGVIGNDGSAKTFLLDLPSGVTPAAVKASSLKYGGPNETVGNIVIENGKIKITLKGVSNQKSIPVNGFDSGNGYKFRTEIGNSIWRYSDGRRWQINDYNPKTNQMTSKNVDAQDSSSPSQRVPTVSVNAMSNQSTLGRFWYTDAGEKIDEKYVNTSNIEVKDTNKSSYVTEVKFPNGKIVTTYTIPVDPKDEIWRDQTKEATMPIVGHVQGRFYSAFVEYYYKATAKLTSYSYSGTINLDYALPDQATLNGTVTLEKPNPNPIKLEGNKVDVKINVKGELLAYTDSSNISEWVFYAKEKNSSEFQMKKEYSKVLSANKSFDFEIPAPRVKDDKFKQEYTLRVIVRFTKPVVTKNGSISSLEQELETYAGVYKKDNPIDYPVSPKPSAKPEGKPPIARISAPKYVKAGDDVLINGSGSSDPDGYITDYAWGVHGSQVGIGNTAKGYVWYTRDDVGQTFPISLTVVDNDGQIGSTSTEITVIEPKPAAIVSISGTLKQNRKTTLTNFSQSPTRFPLVPSKTQVTISAVSGGTNADIKYNGTLADFESKDILFKSPGTYKATIYVENTLGYSDRSELIFDIVPDELPFAYFGMPGKVYRDPSNGNKAVVSIDDMSFTKDKDPLVRRIWEYRYDSNNNGSFADEGWVRFNEENRTRLNLELYEVGKYEIRLTVLEEFGQPTIEQFVTEADRRSINSESTQNLIERIVEVENRSPEVDWDL
ncbi:PKD domain-containing protein [Paenibacillus sp. FSL P4-0288]|uniref:PKD domain-containing protein n=1 Tax=Paenibacillus sp. FSL P4-0288 TaxID=2921633 RepID=UPI0030FAE2B6